MDPPLDYALRVPDFEPNRIFINWDYLRLNATDAGIDTSNFVFLGFLGRPSILYPDIDDVLICTE